MTKYYKYLEGKSIEITKEEYESYSQNSIPAGHSARPTILNEDSPGMALMAPKSRDFDTRFDDDVKAAIEHYQKMNANQKARYIDFMGKVFQDSAWVRNADMKGKNIAPNKMAERPWKTAEEDPANEDWKSVADFLADDLDNTLANCNFTEQARQHCARIFLESVEANSNIVKQALNQFIEQNYGLSPFISDSDLNIVEMLSAKCEWLQEQLDLVEAANYELVEDIQQSSCLTEESDGFFVAPLSTTKKKHSTINDGMLEPTEDADALHQEQTASHQMQRYLAAFGGE